MKPYAFCWALVLVAMLALCPLRMQAQAAAEYAITTSAVGTLGAKIGSTLGAVAKQVPQKVQKETPQPAPPNLSAQPWAAAGKTTDKTPKSSVSNVHIDSTPSGALIFVDNVAFGHTPASLNLPKGIHAIEVRRDGYISWHQAILLSEGENLSLNPALKDPKTSPPLFAVQR